MIRRQLINAFTHAALSPEPDLAVAALMIARVEYPKLDAGPYLDELDAIGCEAKRRVSAALPTDNATPAGVDPERYAQVLALNKYLFGEMHFVGNAAHYEDPRNSFLNQVLERRTGIPVTLRWSTWKSRGARGCASTGSTRRGTSCCGAAPGVSCPTTI